MSCPVLPWLWSTQRTANTTHLRQPAPQLLWQASQPNICQPEHCGDGGSGGVNAGEIRGWKRDNNKAELVSGVKNYPSLFLPLSTDISISILVQVSVIYQSASLKNLVNEEDSYAKICLGNCRMCHPYRYKSLLPFVSMYASISVPKSQPVVGWLGLRCVLRSANSTSEQPHAEVSHSLRAWEK